MAAVIEIKAKKPRGFWNKYKPARQELERMHVKNGLTPTQIADILSKRYGITIPKYSVEHWLKKEKLYNSVQRQKKRAIVIKANDDEFFDTIAHIRDIKDKKAREFLKDEAIKYYYDIIA